MLSVMTFTSPRNCLNSSVPHFRVVFCEILLINFLWSAFFKTSFYFEVLPLPQELWIFNFTFFLRQVVLNHPSNTLLSCCSCSHSWSQQLVPSGCNVVCPKLDRSQILWIWHKSEHYYELLRVPTLQMKSVCYPDNYFYWTCICLDIQNVV